MLDKTDFQELVKLACAGKESKEFKFVIEKELLHYQILYAMAEAGLMRDLTFQGGTALRLIHGSNRYSEDLDFTGGENFTSDQLQLLKEAIEKNVTDIYDLETSVKEPKSMRQEMENGRIVVDKWQIKILTNPGDRSIPKQHIKLEVANVPSHTRKLKRLKHNYPFLPDGIQDVMIPTETTDEILADKVIAFGGRNYIKPRDIWDLLYLTQQSAELDIDMVKTKIAEYKIADYHKKYREYLGELDGFIHGGSFHAEMARFIDQDRARKTIDNPQFLDYISDEVGQFLRKTLNRLESDKTPAFEL